jgi:hypothetical protein
MDDREIWLMRGHTIMRMGIFLSLIGLGMVGRLVPHPPNFTPVISVVLFAGFFFRHPAASLCLALGVMAVTDSVIGTYDYRVMMVVYAALLLPVAMRYVLRPRLTAARVAACAVLSQIVFFATTNFAVWICGELYPHTLVGLVECYVAALPFLRNALGGDLFWSAVLFGSYALAVRASGVWFPARLDPAMRG